MHVYKSLTAPSIVTHSVSCSFNGKENLIVVRGSSLLQVFKAVRVQKHVFENDPKDDTRTGDASDSAPEGNRALEGEDTFLDTDITIEAAHEEHTTKLVLESEWPLDGQVTGICAVRTVANPKADSLLISFRHAKMAIVAWDSVAQSLSTVSLHYYEKEFVDSSFLDNTFTSVLRADPHGACASLALQHDSIAFLPIVQSELLDEAPAVNGQHTQLPPLYLPSFVLSASVLNESISNIIDFTFLYEYREPTMAIIYEPTRTWAGTISQHKDTVRYLVLSLDLQQRSSTAIVSAQNLPYDVRRLVPVKEPIGGCLLVGVNELVHIDSQGRQHGVSVNPFSVIVTEDKFLDQKSLVLELDACQITNIPGVEDELLLVTFQGFLYSIKFELESRKVQGFKLTPVDKSIQISCPSSVALVGSRHIFVGSNTSDSKLLQWKRKGEKAETNKSAVVPDKVKVLDSTHDELDDIYGNDDNTNDVSTGAAGLSGQPIVYNVSDALKAYGPIHDMVLGKSNDKLKVVAATGYGSDMSLSIFQQRIYPEKLSYLTLRDSYSRIWTLNPSGISASDENAAFDSFMIASNNTSSSIYKIEHEFNECTRDLPEFVFQEPTFAAKTLLRGQVMAQVHNSGITLFDANWSKLCNRKLKSPPSVVHFADDFITVVYGDNVTAIFQVQKDGEKWKLSVRNLPKSVPKLHYISSAVSQVLAPLIGNADKKRPKRKRDEEPAPVESTLPPPIIPIGFALANKTDSSAGYFSIHLLNFPTLVYDLACLFHLPDSAYLEGTTFKVAEAINDETTATITSIQHFYLTNDSEQDEYLALKTSESHIYFYHIQQHDSKFYLLKTQHSTSLASLLSGSALGEDESMEEQDPIDLIPFKDIDGYSGLFITGACPILLMKEAHGPIHLHKIASNDPIVGFSTFNTTSVYQGFAYLDNKFRFQISKLPSDTDFSIAWPARRVNMGTPLTSICYHESGDVYVAATTGEVDYVGADEDGLPLPGTLEDMPKAKNFQSAIKLISPKTWTVIDEVQLLENETVMTLRSVTLRVSEKNKRKKSFIVFGTSIMRGEDLAAKGGYYVYEAIEVVPEPGKPETSHKLKLVASEVAKGAVTSLCEINGDLLVAQAQKVR